MIDIATISGAISSLQAAGDIAKSMIGLRDAAAIQGKVIELQSVILAAQTSALSAQAEQSALLERIRRLEKEVADVKAWDTEKQRYELKEIVSGNFAYALKEGASPSEPAHKICAKCYQHGKKSILQKLIKGLLEYLHCHDCGAEIFIRRKD